MQHSGPGFARVDPLRGRVSSSLQSEVRKTINHKRSRGNLSAQQSTETGQLHFTFTAAAYNLVRIRNLLEAT